MCPFMIPEFILIRICALVLWKQFVKFEVWKNDELSHYHLIENVQMDEVVFEIPGISIG